MAAGVTYSAPGAHSTRTDLTATEPNRDPQYGEGVEMSNLKAQAPLAAAPQAPTAAPTGDVASALAAAGVRGLSEPTQRPGEAVTNGASAGPGAGVEALGLPQDPRAEKKADAAALGPALQSMVAASSRSDATPSFKRLVRQALANL